jgi:hypothetical protein
VPFRKVTSREVVSRNLTIETLSCNHTYTNTDGTLASKRRCYTCAWQSNHPKGGAK